MLADVKLRNGVTCPKLSAIFCQEEFERMGTVTSVALTSWDVPLVQVCRGLHVAR